MTLRAVLGDADAAVERERVRYPALPPRVASAEAGDVVVREGVVASEQRKALAQCGQIAAPYPSVHYFKYLCLMDTALLILAIVAVTLSIVSTVANVVILSVFRAEMGKDLRSVFLSEGRELFNELHLMMRCKVDAMERLLASFKDRDGKRGKADGKADK